MKALEFYSGIGGLHLALKRSKAAATITHAFDWDQNACEVYSSNFGTGIATKKTDISTLTADYLTSLDAALWLLSPACQPYTVLNPQAKGDLDPRAKSFSSSELAMRNAHPTHFLVENVAGFETSTTRQILVLTLHRLGYTTAEFLLTPPPIRYSQLASTRPPHCFKCSELLNSGPLRFIPGLAEDPPWTDVRSEGATSEIKEYLDQESDEGCAIPDKVLNKWGRLFDIVLPSSRRTCCFTRGYTQLVERAGSVLQMNECLDTTAVFDTFLEQKNTNEAAVRILDALQLRYFSPDELLRLFAFSPPHTAPEFVWPSGISRKTKYRLIGNSVNVRVVQELISYLFEEPVA
ncbi:S-adenosyl-L-methionine-dependent methyltransferase [Mycena amicta]|nr:S-adenosyl-L-methionine-dependent methyltransferase [Mycena amicta]